MAKWSIAPHTMLGDPSPTCRLPPLARLSGHRPPDHESYNHCADDDPEDGPDDQLVTLVDRDGAMGMRDSVVRLMRGRLFAVLVLGRVIGRPLLVRAAPIMRFHNDSPPSD